MLRAIAKMIRKAVRTRGTKAILKNQSLISKLSYSLVNETIVNLNSNMQNRKIIALFRMNVFINYLVNTSLTVIPLIINL